MEQTIDMLKLFAKTLLDENILHLVNYRLTGQIHSDVKKHRSLSLTLLFVASDLRCYAASPNMLRPRQAAKAWPKAGKREANEPGVGPELHAFYEDEDVALKGVEPAIVAATNPLQAAPFPRHARNTSSPETGPMVAPMLTPYRPSSKTNSLLSDRPHTSGAYIKYTCAGGA